MTVKILRANATLGACPTCGTRSRRHRAEVAAFVDACKVTWTPTRGWACRDCDEDGDTCRHVDAVAELLAPSITTTRKKVK